MRFDPRLADIRFGCGLSPTIAPAPDAEALLATLTAGDDIATRHPIEPFETFLVRMETRADLTKVMRDNRGTPKADAVREEIRLLNRNAQKAQIRWMARHLARRIETRAPFRERLSFFWADHFTATGKAGISRRATSPYIESAIRPHVSGRFEDLLIAAVTHPVMLLYLDQTGSVGPNAPRARKSRRGLNENLAREVLELHTLGVDGPYAQNDVRELAELFTGLTANPRRGGHFRADFAEPGAETVLGRSYGGTGAAHVGDIEAVLRDLARHPATARHIAGKIAVHFVSDRPDPSLVGAIERTWLETDGELTACYAALLSHPSAMQTDRRNVKLPFDFIASALRALAPPTEALTALDERMIRQRIQHPLRLMGHIWEEPASPAGLEEDDDAWITPQGVAARLQWALTVPSLLMPDLPDPRAFVSVALGPDAPPNVRFAADTAETRSDGIGLVLASPAFQRM